MSLESFRELCNKWKFYWFNTLEDFDKWIDYNWINLKKKWINFTHWVIDEYKEYPYDIMTHACPTRWSAYWITKNLWKLN